MIQIFLVMRGLEAEGNEDCVWAQPFGGAFPEEEDGGFVCNKKTARDLLGHCMLSNTGTGLNGEIIAVFEARLLDKTDDYVPEEIWGE